MCMALRNRPSYSKFEIIICEKMGIVLACAKLTIAILLRCSECNYEVAMVLL